MQILSILGGILITVPFIVWAVIAFFEKQNATHFYWKRTCLFILFPLSIIIGIALIVVAVVLFI